MGVAFLIEIMIEAGGSRSGFGLIDTIRIIFGAKRFIAFKAVFYNCHSFCSRKVHAHKKRKFSLKVSV